MKKMLIAVLFTILLLLNSGAANAFGSTANILLYHRFGEDKYPSTNITIDQFEAHLNELERGGYQILPLLEIVRRIKQNLPMPEHTVALTVDDAYLSFAKEAWPRLKKRGIPVTLFVSTDSVDANLEGYLSWSDLRALKKEGVTIGHHGAAHTHMPDAGVFAAKEDIERASARFQTELKEIPSLFAYPYGEYSPELRDLVTDQGFKGAFAQYSSPAGLPHSPYSLPRFALNETYGAIERFRLIINTIGLPSHDILPMNPILQAHTNPPYFGFSVTSEIENLSDLSCFPSHMNEKATLIFPVKNRVEVRFTKPFPKGRARINCTMPARDGRFYWLGAYFQIPE